MGKFGPRRPGLAYLLQGLVWHLERKRRIRRRQKQNQTWRLVRAVAAHSRQQQQTTPRARQLDLPDKTPDRQDNLRYLACHHKTLVPPTKIPFQTVSNPLIITPGRRRSGDSP